MEDGRVTGCLGGCRRHRVRGALIALFGHRLFFGVQIQFLIEILAAQKMHLIATKTKVGDRN